MNNFIEARRKQPKIMLDLNKMRSDIKKANEELLSYMKQRSIEGGR